jgi:glycosyltransferase involved in cell wall biosynthesis
VTTSSAAPEGTETCAADEEITPPAVFLMTNTLETGGSERQFVTMARALDGDKFSVRLGCLNPVGPFLREVEGIEPFPVGGSLFGLQSWRSRLVLARFLRRHRIAVAQSFDFYSNLMLIPAARFARVPVVLGSHRQLGDLLTWRQFQAQNAVFRMCDRVVCNSAAAAGRLRNAGIPSGKLAVIANGLSDETFAAVAPALSREPETVTIGMIARMNHPVKQHDLFLRAAARLATRFPQLRFVLAGDGPLRPGLEGLAGQLKLLDRVIFLGDRRDIPAVLASLDISVMPSSSESLSNVILESMAAGVPVVAARIGGNPELVQEGKTGFLFSPGDEVQFAAVLETLVMQPELRKQFGAIARARAEGEYAIPRVRDRYQDLYRSLLEEKGWTAPASFHRLEPARTSPEARTH